LADGGGGREKCPTPCEKGGGIVRGELSGKNMSMGNVRIPKLHTDCYDLRTRKGNFIIPFIWCHGKYGGASLCYKNHCEAHVPHLI